MGSVHREFLHCYKIIHNILFSPLMVNNCMCSLIYLMLIKFCLCFLNILSKLFGIKFQEECSSRMFITGINCIYLSHNFKMGLAKKGI